MSSMRFAPWLLRRPAALALLSTITLAATAAPSSRHIEINGRALDAAGLQVIGRLEAQLGRVPDGRYWYDRMTGAVGVVGGPVATVLQPGLPFSGTLRADGSGGGNGKLTGVFVNGRELHPFDVQRLATVGPVVPGRYWWDAAGNVGLEGGPMLFNFHAAVRSHGGNNPYYRSDIRTGDSVFVTQGCAAVSGRTSPSDSSSGYSYYVGCD